MASRPAASAIWASRIFSAKVFYQRSGTVVAAPRFAVLRAALAWLPWPGHGEATGGEAGGCSRGARRGTRLTALRLEPRPRQALSVSIRYATVSHHNRSPLGPGLAHLLGDLQALCVL